VRVVVLVGICKCHNRYPPPLLTPNASPPPPPPPPPPDYTVNPQRMEYGWTSNNSVFAKLGMDYGAICERVRKNGEPGFAWLDNMRVRVVVVVVVVVVVDRWWKWWWW